ncbi:hypothetical protein LguiA_018679 [Lonicera macranthoides]
MYIFHPIQTLASSFLLFHISVVRKITLFILVLVSLCSGWEGAFYLIGEKNPNFVRAFLCISLFGKAFLSFSFLR